MPDTEVKPAEQQAVKPDEGAAPAEQKPAEGQKPAEPPKPQILPPVARRIGHLTREAAQAKGRAQELEQQNQRLAAELAAARGQPAQQQQPPVQLDPNLVRTEAQKLVAQQQYIESSNKTLEKGHAEFPDFESKLSQLGQLGDFSHETLANIVVGSDVAHKVLYHLANNLDVAADILSLPPVQQARAIGKLEATLSTAREETKETSNAPAPIKPLSGRSPPPSGPSEKDSVEDWIAKRREQIAARRKRRA